MVRGKNASGQKKIFLFDSNEIKELPIQEISEIIYGKIGIFNKEDISAKDIISGKELWRYSIGFNRRIFGSVVLCDEKVLIPITENDNGLLLCLDLKTGEILWEIKVYPYMIF